MCAGDESPNAQQSEPKPFPSEFVEGRERRGKMSLLPTPWDEDGGRRGRAAVLAGSPGRWQRSRARLFGAEWVCCTLALPGNFTFVEMSMHM